MKGEEAMNDKMASPKKEDLLEEYAASLEYARHHSDTIWQTASIFLNLSLAGIAYFAGTRVESIPSLVGRAIIAGGAIAVLQAWHSFFKRWNSYLQVGFYRMSEIEETLGLWLVRYGTHLREWTLSGTVPDEPDPEAKKRYERLRQDRRFQHFYPRPHGRIVKAVVTLLIAGWIAIVILNAVSLFLCESKAP
jgi:hypothetical protein